MCVCVCAFDLHLTGISVKNWNSKAKTKTDLLNAGKRLCTYAIWNRWGYVAVSKYLTGAVLILEQWILHSVQTFCNRRFDNVCTVPLFLNGWTWESCNSLAVWRYALSDWGKHSIFNSHYGPMCQYLLVEIQTLTCSHGRLFCLVHVW